MKMFRSLIALLLLASLVLTVCPALAADALTITYLGTVDDGIIIEKDHYGDVLKTTVAATTSGSITLTLYDAVDKTYPVVYTTTKTGVTAGQEITWALPYYAKDMNLDKPTKMLRAYFQMDGRTYTFDLYYNYGYNKNTNKEYVTVDKDSWYPNNTACSFGPAFRDEQPELTTKWYTFTPIDLTIQGRQSFEYVASNMWVIGQVNVDVFGDNVVVTYQNYYASSGGNTTTLSEFFTFFHDLYGVTEVEPENMADKGYAFGQVISIQNDLGGDTNVLLFVRNRVTYCNYVTLTHKLTRFWPNLPQRVEIRNAMKELMDKEGSY